MSMTTISTIYTPKTYRNYPHTNPNITTTPTLLITRLKTPFNNLLQLHRTPLKTLPLISKFSGAKLEFRVNAQNGVVGDGGGDEEERELAELRGKSTMPDRFKYLSKEVPSPPLLWPWFVALAFLVYTWRSVLWELSNWQKGVMSIFGFVGYLCKLALAIIFHFFGGSITQLIVNVEAVLYPICDFFISIATSAPIPELITILILASTVLAIGEAASPNSINSQPYALTVAGIIGYGAVQGVVLEPTFWLLLIGIFAFSRLVKKRDYVSSALPVATVLASVGEPWVRVSAIVLYSALAIHHHYKKQEDGKEDQVQWSNVKIPFPLWGVALAIGIRVVAMIVGLAIAI